jgi:hypothetical protein
MAMAEIAPLLLGVRVLLGRGSGASLAVTITAYWRERKEEGVTTMQVEGGFRSRSWSDAASTVEGRRLWREGSHKPIGRGGGARKGKVGSGRPINRGL